MSYLHHLAFNFRETFSIVINQAKIDTELYWKQNQNIQRKILLSLFLSLGVIRGLLENLLSRRSLVFVNTEEGQDQLVDLVILEFSLQWTLHILPAIDVLLGVEEMLPVVGDVGDDGSKTPHVSRGGDVTVISQNQHKSFRNNSTR